MDWPQSHQEFIRDGFAWVGVSAQTTGVNALKNWDSARYGSLQESSDDVSWDVFTKAGQVVRAESSAIFGGLNADRVLATGQSQSALRLVTYTNAIQPLANAFDGIMIHSRSNGAVGLRSGDSTPSPASIRTDSKGRPRISGSVQIRRGRLRVLKNTLEVRQATVRFSGEVDPDPALDILLERTAPEALVLIQLSGTVKAPELSLRSDPPVYDQGQILSLLLTGRVDSRSDAGGADPSMAIAGAISQALLGNVLQKVAPKVGIDVARVNLDQTKDQKTGESQLRAEAEVGKYLTERLYTGYRRVFGASAQENTNEGLLEYRISGGWLLTALFGDAGVGGLDLLWNYRH